MGELKKLRFNFSSGEFPRNPDDPIAEETKQKVRDFIEKFNNIARSIEKVSGEEDVNYFRAIHFKVRALRKIAKERRIDDVPDIVEVKKVDRENLIIVG